MAGSEDPINAAVWVFFAGIIALVLLLYPFLKRRKPRDEEDEAQGPRNQPVAVDRGTVRGRRTRTMRSQAEYVRRLQHTAGGGPQNEDDEEEEDIDEEITDELQKIPGKIGTKKLKKIQAKAEKKALREQEEALREDKKRREALRHEELRKEEEKQKLLDEKMAEEEKKRKEEQERREHEEYLKLKEAFTVEEEGEKEGEDEQESQGLLQEFIEYIKSCKVVLLEELAAQFSLRTQEAVDRIKQLQEMGRLTGVLDDRGKFIYISAEELDAVASFIKQKGRISLQQLANSSNTLINLS